MTRLIDAEILFEKVGNIKPKNKSEYELIGKFMNMITDSPTVERPHREWIPCSERLPSSDGKYLINYHSPRGNNRIQIQNFMNGDWYPNFGKSYITAWMPLPEPYMREGEAE